MADVVHEHLEHLRGLGYSPSTLTARAAVLATIPDLLGMDRESTQAWWATRQTRADGKPRAKSSLSAEKSHAAEFWRWAIQQGRLDRNPADWLGKVRIARTMAVVVPEADLYRVMRESHPPMRQMLALGAMAGLRSAEIAAIRWSDIDHASGVLWVRAGKGSKDRSVPLSAGLLGELGDPGDGLIVGRAMTPKAASMAIGRHLRTHGCDLTAHKLRARYATRFLAATGDAIATAKALGHSDLSSVMRYAVASSDTMRRGAEAAGRIG